MHLAGCLIFYRQTMQNLYSLFITCSLWHFFTRLIFFLSQSWGKTYVGPHSYIYLSVFLPCWIRISCSALVLSVQWTSSCRLILFHECAAAVGPPCQAALYSILSAVLVVKQLLYPPPSWSGSSSAISPLPWLLEESFMQIWLVSTFSTSWILI